MRKMLLFTILFILSLNAPIPANAAESLVTKWITAMMNNGEGINSIIAPDFTYNHYSFEMNDTWVEAKKGDIPFFAKASKPVEINIEEISPVPGGDIAILNAVAEEGLYREWEIRLFITSAGISRVTELALEGVNEGYPTGCPMTAYRRNMVVTLHGEPEGMNGRKHVRLYQMRRDTDLWDFAHPGVDEKMFKYCTPRPDTYLVTSEVIVFNESGIIEGVQTVAALHKGEKDEDANGAVFFSEDGINYPGRLFVMEPPKQGLLLTFSVINKNKIDNVSKLYTWKSGKWKSIWGYTVGSGSDPDALGNSSNRFEWRLTSQPNGDISATLEKNRDKKYSCPEYSTLSFERKKLSYKLSKSDTPRSCATTSKISDSALVAYKKEDTGRTFFGEAPEIDWKFRR